MLESSILVPFLVILLGWSVFYYLRKRNLNQKDGDSRYRYPFVTPLPTDLYYPDVMIPWNYSTWGPDTNRRTFEIGN